MNIEEKTKLAHEWSMWFLDKNKDMAFAPNTVAYNAWGYADAMEVEAEKRIKAKAEKDAEESKVFFEKLTKNEGGLCKPVPPTMETPPIKIIGGG